MCMEIQYETYGILHDCEKKKVTVNTVSILATHNIHLVLLVAVYISKYCNSSNKCCCSSQQDTNPLWPQFDDASPLEKTIYMPELVICLFAIY